MKGYMKIFYGAALALAIMAAPLAAEARPFGPCGPGNYGNPGFARQQMQQLPPEKLDQLRALQLEHRKAVQPLRDQLWTKRALLEALSGNPKADPKELRELVAEMAELRAKLREVRLEFSLKMQNETGYDGPCPAFGMWDNDHGPGRHGGYGGYGGGHRGGPGRGGCGW